MIDDLTLVRYPIAMALEHDSETALARAVREAGSQSAFGRLIDKRQSVINGWLREGRPLPAEFVLTIEAATGISRHELRPDIYPIEPPASAGSHGDQTAAPSGAAPASSLPRVGAGVSSTGPLHGLVS